MYAITPVTIDLNNLNGSEVDLKSVRRTQIELDLIRQIIKAQCLLDSPETWEVADDFIIAIDPKTDSMAILLTIEAMIAGGDEDKEMDHVLVYTPDKKIYRSPLMSESKIFTTIKRIARSNITAMRDPCKQVKVEWIYRTN